MQSPSFLLYHDEVTGTKYVVNLVFQPLFVLLFSYLLLPLARLHLQ